MARPYQTERQHRRPQKLIIRCQNLALQMTPITGGLYRYEFVCALELNSLHFAFQKSFLQRMGCGTSKSLPYEEDYNRNFGDDQPAQRSTEANRKRPSVGIGRPVGGLSKAGDKRAAQLAAAEKRAVAMANRGLGSPSKGVELNESAKRQELIGRIQAHYSSTNKEPPMGLNMASLDQLKNHYDAIRKTSDLPTTTSIV